VSSHSVTNRSARRVATVSVLILCLAAVGFILSNQFPVDEVPHRVAPLEEASDTEAWVERLAARGEGVVRIEVTDQLEPTDLIVRTAGPLSGNGKRALEEFLSMKRQKLQRRVNERSEPRDGQESLADYAKDLRLIASYEKMCIYKELFTRGVYLTLGEQPSDVPPLAPGVTTYQTGPFELANGEWGHVMFFVDMQKRQSTRDILAALREVVAEDREHRFREFHLRSQEEQKRWIDRYLDLAKNSEGELTKLTVDEMREFLAMQRELDFMRATVDRATGTIRHRS
jgi:hypothetical protein